MMPSNGLSQVAYKYKWRGLDLDDPTGLTDFEEGGIALNNNSAGMEYQVWTFSVVGKSAVVEAANSNGQTVLFTLSIDIQEIAGCFDQNMAPFVAYKAADQWHYYWYDTVTAGYVFSDLPVGVDSCRCTLDDKRQFNAPNSDILLFYTKDNNLYMRRQRDRYQNEILVKSGIGGRLVKVGMNGISRLQFKMITT